MAHQVIASSDGFSYRSPILSVFAIFWHIRRVFRAVRLLVSSQAYMMPRRPESGRITDS